MLILEKVGELKGDRWTANTFNHYQKYLSILFKELVELDAIELNPIAGIAKQKTIKKIRQVLSLEERKTINTFYTIIIISSGSSCKYFFTPAPGGLSY